MATDRQVVGDLQFTCCDWFSLSPQAGSKVFASLIKKSGWVSVLMWVSACGFR